MSNRKRRAKATAAHNRDHQQALIAVLYLGAVVLAFNAWLVSQQLVRF